MNALTSVIKTEWNILPVSVHLSLTLKETTIIDTYIIFLKSGDKKFAYKFNVDVLQIF